MARGLDPVPGCGPYLWLRRELERALVALVQEVLKSAEVRASFGAARHGWVKPLGKYTWLSSLGSNCEGILAHAAKDNEPIGLRRVHEEIAQTVSPLGTADGDKLRTG